MTNEENIQFILAQQARFAASLEKDEERPARLEQAFVILTELARSADERMDDFSANSEFLNSKMAELAQAQRQLTQAQQQLAETQTRTQQQLTDTDDRLNTFINVLERYISEGRNGKSQQ